MKKNSDNSPKTDLRQQAEAKLSERKKKTAATPAAESDTKRLVHELEVHQIELEMQNEELVKARAEVEAILHQYTDLYDFAPIGYFTLASDGTIHQVNLAGASLLCVERGKLIQRRFGVFVSAESRATFSDFLEKVFSANGSKETCEVALQKDGSAPLCVHIEANTKDKQRETCHAVMVDITERKQAEESLQASETRYRSVLQSAPDAIVTADNNGIIVGWNSGAERIFGYSYTEAAGQSLTSIMPLYQQAGHTNGMKRVLSGGDQHVIGKTVELEGLRKDKSVFPLELSLSTWETNEGQYFTGIIRDITERKRAEEKLRQQLNELRRWQEVTLGREDRNMQLKAEVNKLLIRLGEPIRYPSQEKDASKDTE
jgi:PAS domain S-box-containing protein